MKKYPGIFSAIVLAAIAAVGCAQSSDKKAVGSATVGPELRWKRNGRLNLLDPHGRGRPTLHRFLCRQLLRS